MMLYVPNRLIPTSTPACPFEFSVPLTVGFRTPGPVVVTWKVAPGWIGVVPRTQQITEVFPRWSVTSEIKVGVKLPLGRVQAKFAVPVPPAGTVTSCWVVVQVAPSGDVMDTFFAPVATFVKL